LHRHRGVTAGTVTRKTDHLGEFYDTLNVTAVASDDLAAPYVDAERVISELVGAA